METAVSNRLDVYLRPGGLLAGEAARQAVAQGMAGYVAGGMIACSLFEVIGRRGGKISRQWHSYRDIRLSADAEIRRLLGLIEAPRGKLCGFSLSSPVIMGIVNVTPDSFSDGGDFLAPDAAIQHGRTLAAAGAQILDIGGESTRPGAAPVSEAAELERVGPVIKALAGDGHCVSIDSRKPGVFASAAELGAQIVNDVSALEYSPESLEVAARTGLPVVLMHAQGTPETMQDKPEYGDVTLDVFDYLAGRIAACEKAGIARDKIIADPGIGFGKTLAHNLQLIDDLAVFHGLGVPLLLGASRKSFIGRATGIETAASRVPGSLGAALMAVERGVQILRVHDVEETRQALALWKAVGVVAKL